MAGTDANASNLGSARRWRVAFGRWPNVPVDKRELHCEKLQSQLRLRAMNDDASKANSERFGHEGMSRRLFLRATLAPQDCADRDGAEPLQHY